MTQPEFLAWREFYVLFPFDDLHRYHRPAALVASSMSGEVQEKLEWLAPEPRNAGLDDADLNTMRALGYKSKGM